jgi:hypothetical protein
LKKELVKALEELLLENKESTKPTAYTNGFNNALVQLIHKMELSEHFTNRKDLWD